MSELSQHPGRAGAGIVRRDERLKGILCLVAGIALFSLQDLIIKLLSSEYPVHQALAVRAATTAPILLALVAVDGGLRSLASPRAGLLLVRGCVMFAAYLSYYLGLAALPLAYCVSLYFTAPLFITALSTVVLGERVGPRRWAAVAIGFAGVLVMVRPGSEVFDWAALLPVAAACAYAVSTMLARHLGATESAGVMSFYGNAIYLIAGLALAAVFGDGRHAMEVHDSLAFLTRSWVMPTATDLALMIFCGVLAAGGLSFLSQAYRVAPAAVVAPFEYTSLGWGVLWGYLFFSDLPGPWTWVGVSIIVGAGLFVLYRERATGRPTLWRRGGWRRLNRRPER